MCFLIFRPDIALLTVSSSELELESEEDSYSPSMNFQIVSEAKRMYLRASEPSNEDTTEPSTVALAQNSSSSSPFSCPSYFFSPYSNKCDGK
jgi:hypothetical protein